MSKDQALSEANREITDAEQALINDGPKFVSQMDEREQILSLDRLWNPNS